MKISKKAYQMISTLIFICFVLWLTFFIALRVLGFSPYMVLSKSMEPKYPLGSLVYVKETQKENLNVGDSITFTLGKSDKIITHQIININDDYYYTKGIANSIQDENPVRYENIIGKVYFCIPYMGYISALLSSRIGFFLINIVIFLLITEVIIGLISKNNNIRGNQHESKKIN